MAAQKLTPSATTRFLCLPSMSKLLEQRVFQTSTQNTQLTPCLQKRGMFSAGAETGLETIPPPRLGWDAPRTDHLPTTDPQDRPADPKGQGGHSLRTTGRGAGAESFTPKQDHPPAATCRVSQGPGSASRPPLPAPSATGSQGNFGPTRLSSSPGSPPGAEDSRLQRCPPHPHPQARLQPRGLTPSPQSEPVRGCLCRRPPGASSQAACAGPRGCPAARSQRPGTPGNPKTGARLLMRSGSIWRLKGAD